MAVTIKKKNLTLISLVNRLFGDWGVAGGDFLKKAQELEIQGYKLKTNITTFAIEFDAGKEMVTVSQVPLKLDTVQLAMKKKLGHTVKAIVKDKVIDLINVAYQKYMDVEHPAMNYQTYPQAPLLVDVYEETMAKYHGPNGALNKVAAIKQYRNMTGCSLKEAKDKVEEWIDAITPVMEDPEPTPEMTEEIDISNIKMQQMTTYSVELDLHTTPVPLKDAQKLNQPVCGTSGGSIYHVIAIGDSCVVAARIKSNNEIAIRAELKSHPNSSEAQKVKSGLIFAGLEKKTAGHYSLHLTPEDFNMVKRSIGSTIMAMSIPFWGVSTDLNLIQGAGK